ncbi:energy transducer TonB [Flavobacterium praedii]|uniref:energy transducer TonB n=1 Tax=Flavobacterium praedii TaxID=3002900 RepID=UPI002481DD87|nr:energy transducer TonB [Flavobacterium praedii]
MKIVILVFLTFITLAIGQNKKNNFAIIDKTLKIPENYTKRKYVESYDLICGTEDYIYIPDADNYYYQFYKKNNRVYCQGELTNIEGNEFHAMEGYKYFKNNFNVYYYDGNLGLQEIPNINVNSSRIVENFLVDNKYLYLKTVKTIGSQGFKLVSSYKFYKEAISGNDTSNNSYVEYYLFRNNKGYWIVKLSNVITYNFLGKVYNHKWDLIYEKENPNNDLEEIATAYSIALVDNKPEFPGGIDKLYDFLNQNFKVEEKELEGRIHVSFIVEIDGSLSNLKILRDLGYGTGKELIRILKISPKWNPAILNNKKVRCQYQMSYLVNN